MSNPKEYYGGFFWLAAVSMIVPLFVAYKAIDKVTPTSKPVSYTHLTLPTIYSV